MNFFKKILTLGGILSSKKDTKKKTNAKSAKNNGKKKVSATNRIKSEGTYNKGKDSYPKKSSKSTNRYNDSKRKGLSSSYSETGKSEKKQRKPRVVPEVYADDILNEKVPEFVALGLNNKVLSGVCDMNYTVPTPIQKSAIPIILDGNDVIGTAQTGTGKTAAFSLPIVSLLEPMQSPNVQVLVLSPTRELASQTAEAFKNFSKFTNIDTLLVQGGISMQNQIDAIERGVDVIVATPGRLLDLIRQKAVSLRNIKYLVLDEVDRMFDMGFIEDVSNIIRYCPKERQTLFFSATMPDAVMKLSKWALKSPERLESGVNHSPADTIEHFVYPVDGIQKYDLLIELLKSITFDSMIVFTRTRVDADRISEWLVGHDYKVSTLHSDRTQRERDKALADFKTAKTSILVATDIASRGLDISNVGYVINYNVPEHAEDYVHRIGRTGRANKEGRAITLFSSDETDFLKRIEAFINAKIERRKLENFAYRNEPILIEEVKKARRRNK